MPKVFKLSPKRKTCINGETLSPSMEVIITTNLSNPFNNGGTEVKEAYMRKYGVDLTKRSANKSDFDIVEDK